MPRAARRPDACSGPHVMVRAACGASRCLRCGRSTRARSAARARASRGTTTRSSSLRPGAGDAASGPTASRSAAARYACRDVQGAQRALSPRARCGAHPPRTGRARGAVGTRFHRPRVDRALERRGPVTSSALWRHRTVVCVRAFARARAPIWRVYEWAQRLRLRLTHVDITTCNRPTSLRNTGVPRNTAWARAPPAHHGGRAPSGSVVGC
jgi:hypothetical protein